MGEVRKGMLRAGFDRAVKLELRGPKSARTPAHSPTVTSMRRQACPNSPAEPPGRRLGAGLGHLRQMLTIPRRRENGRLTRCQLDS